MHVGPVHDALTSHLSHTMVQIKELATKYSEFISFPIEVWAEKTTYDQVPDPDAEVKEGEQPKMKTVTRTAMQWEVNAQWGIDRSITYTSVSDRLACISTLFSGIYTCAMNCPQLTGIGGAIGDFQANPVLYGR